MSVRSCARHTSSHILDVFPNGLYAECLTNPPQISVPRDTRDRTGPFSSSFEVSRLKLRPSVPLGKVFSKSTIIFKHRVPARELRPRLCELMMDGEHHRHGLKGGMHEIDTQGGGNSSPFSLHDWLKDFDEIMYSALYNEICFT